MKTLFGERKSVKTLAFILALALILPLLPVMSVGAETSAQLSEITFVNGAKDDNGYYFMSPDGKKEIYSAESDKGETLTIGNVVLSVKTSVSDIVATYSRVRQDLVFRVIGTNGTDRDDIKVKVEPTTGGAESTFYLPQNDDGTYTLPVIPPSDGVYGTDGHAKVTVESDTSSKILNLTSVATGVEISKIKLGKNKISGQVDATITVSADYASKNLIVETRQDANHDWTAVVEVKAAEDNPNKYTWTISALESNMEARIKLEGTKEFNVTVTNEDKLANGVKVTGNRKVSYGGTLDINVTTPQGMQAPVIKIEMGNGNDVTKSANATPITGGYNYRLTNVTNHITITVEAPNPITHNLTKAPTNDDRFAITYNQKGTGDGEIGENNTINEGNSLTVNVTPKPGYKVQNITVKASDSGMVLGSTTANTITVTNIRENVSVTVDVVPITITVKVNNGGDLNGSYVFKYGESGFNTDLISWGELPKSNAVFNKDKIDDLVKLVQGALNKNPDGIPTRFGFDFVETAKDSTKGWIIADESLKVNPNADVTITLTGNWKPKYEELFVLTTTTHYENGNNTLSFISKLAVSDSADDAAKAEYGSLIVNVHSFGVFFGEYPSSLNGDFTLMKNVRDYINDHKNQTSTQEKVTTNLWGANAQKGDVYFYSTNLSENLAEFQVSGNTITETFAEQRTAQRSGITWVEISVGEDQEHTIVIVGPATEYLGA